MLNALRSSYVILLFVAGCAQVGMPVPETFNQKLAVAYSSVTAVRTTAVTLLDAKKLTADDGQNILEQTNNARAGLDVAKALSNTDMNAAEGRLNAVRTVLTAISTYLATRQ